MSGPRSTPDLALCELFTAEIVANAKPIAAFVKRGFVHDGEPLPEDITRALHSINGAARIVEASTLSALVEAAERSIREWSTLKPAQAQVAYQLLADLHGFLQRLEKALEPMAFLEQSAVEQKAMTASFDRVKHDDSKGYASQPGPSKTAEQAMLDASLLEIFRTEVEQCVSVLSEGLVVLDTDAPTPSLWERLMRAAHSLKGAARIVKLNSMAQLAHSLEDCLVLAQGGSVTLTSDDIDVLLKSVDAVKKAGTLICEGSPGGRTEAEAIADVAIAQLSALLGISGTTMQHNAHDMALMRTQLGGSFGANKASAGVVISVPPYTAGPMAGLGIGTAMERSSTFPPPTLSTPPEPSTPPPPKPISVRVAAAKESNDRVLKVAAASINALVGLAGETMVESRRIASFTQGLTRMKKQQGMLIELINGIERQLLLHTDADGMLKQRVTDAKLQARECARVLGEHGAGMDDYVRRAEQLGERMYREALKSRMRPFADGTHGFARQVRDLARDLGKRAKLELAGQHTEVDRDALEALDAPLNHLMRNSLDHGIESPQERVAAGKNEMATVRIDAHHHAGMLSIVVSDDGRGIDPESVRTRIVERGLTNSSVADTLTRAELLDFLFLPGFSTAAVVSEISGRGVGLDVVKTSVEALGGSVRVSSELGKGTQFHLQLPITRSVIRAVVAAVDGEAYAFPLLRIDRIARLPRTSVKTIENRQYVVIDDRPLSLISARHILNAAPTSADTRELNVVVVSDRKRQFGILVDEFRGEHDLVVRPLDVRLGKIQDIAAAAILMDGSAALIIDVDDIVRSIDRIVQGGGLQRQLAIEESMPQKRRKRVLVVDDSITVREAERQLLANRGYEVEVAVDGVDGLGALKLASYDLVITDIDMPRMNGIDLVRAIKQDEKLSATPVVVVSYKDRDEDRLRGLEAGANYYLAKSSFHDDKLVQAVEDLIGGAST